MSRRPAYLNVLASAVLGLVLIVIGIGWLPAELDRGQQLESQRAPVVLDGQPLFYVNSIAGFTAQTRASAIGSALAEAVATHGNVTRPPRVWLSQRGDLVTLRLQGRHLLTVTDADSMAVGDTSAVWMQREQARQWMDQLETALARAIIQRSRPYRQQALLRSLVATATVLVAVIAIRRWQRRLARREAGRRGGLWAVNLGLVLLQLNLLGTVVLVITQQFPELRIWRYRLLRVLERTFTDPLFTIDDKGYSLLDSVNLLALVIGLWLVVRALTLVLTSQLRAKEEHALQDALSVFLQVIFTGLGLVILLQAVGIDISALAILVSVLGVGVGFGLQNVANNLISGVIILLERPIQAGDFVNLGNLVGTVERVGARSTEIRTLDLVTIIVPNSEFIESKVINWSHGHPLSRLHIPLGVAYDTNIRHLRNTVLEAAHTHPEVLRFPKPQLWFKGFGDSALDFDLLVWVREPRHQQQIRSDLYYLLEANLRRHHIKIPFPQRDLYVRFADGQSPAAQPPAQPSPSADSALPPLGASDTTIPIDILADLSDLTECSLLIREQESLSEADVQRLVAEMRGPNGIDRRDRRHRLRLFEQCFVGSEAVTWLVRTQKTTRDQAVAIGQILVDRCIIHHVTDEHPFMDDYLFYRFYEDEPNYA
ncbi:MAG: mechanosensitive ion channel domain-containing protein [Cyanobacteria bacterium P01_A01_bin.135]